MDETDIIVIKDLIKNRLATFTIDQHKDHFAIRGHMQREITPICKMLIELLKDEDYRVRFKSAWMLERIYFTERIKDSTLLDNIETIISLYETEEEEFTKYYLAEILYLLIVFNKLAIKPEILIPINMEKLEEERKFHPFTWFRNSLTKTIETINKTKENIQVNRYTLIISDIRFEDELVDEIYRNDEEIIYEVIDVYSRIGSLKALKLTKEIYEKEEDQKRKFELLIALARIEGLDSHWYQLLDKLFSNSLMDKRQKSMFSILQKELKQKKEIVKTSYLVSPEVNELLHSIDDMTPTNKIKTLKKIGESGPENTQAGSKIINFLLNDPNEKVRLESAQTIAKIAYPIDRKVLDEVLSDPKNDNIKADLLVAAQSLLATTELSGVEQQMRKEESEKYIPTIFLAGVNEDKDKLNEIYKKLTRNNYADVFMFLAKKYIGEKFKPANDERIKKSDFFIPCFSSNAQKRLDSLFHREVAIGLDTLLSRHPDALYFLPIKLDECDIPNYVVESERAKDITYAKYSDDNWMKQIKESIERELKRRSKLEKEHEK